MNGTLWDNRDNFERYNPINFIHNWATPHFVVHNDLDFRLPVSEGLFLFNVLQEKGVPSKFLNFPDENHWSVCFPLQGGGSLGQNPAKLLQGA